MTYPEYLQTDHWQELRKKVLNDPYYGRAGECFLCKTKDRLIVHHLTYVRKGAEDEADLLILCTRCHDKVHVNGAGRRQTKDIFMKVFKIKYRPIKQLERQSWREYKAQLNNKPVYTKVVPVEKPVINKPKNENRIPPSIVGTIAAYNGLWKGKHPDAFYFMLLQKERIKKDEERYMYLVNNKEKMIELIRHISHYHE